ncbi:MAG: hypothetical protein WBB65_05660 [Anaerolineales bacterium]
MRGELPQPDRDRLSTLTALVILSYALIRIVVLPIFSTELTFAGLIFELKVDTRLIMLALVAALTVAGADWLIQSHPAQKSGERTFEHWIVPGLTALAAGTILTRLPEGPALWIGLTAGATLLMAVLLAEFLIHDPADPRHDLAAVVLRTLAFLLLVGILFTMHAIDLRSVYRVPLSLAIVTVISWRLLKLSTSANGQAIVFALIGGGISAQLVWALHYWPLPSFRFALIVGLFVYISIGLMETMRAGEMSRARLVEFAAVALVGLTGILVFS